MTKKPDPLKPSLTLLVKLGSIAVHAQELLSPRGHAFDKVTLDTVMHDPEVEVWIKAMGVYMPVKR